MLRLLPRALVLGLVSLLAAACGGTASTGAGGTSTGGGGNTGGDTGGTGGGQTGECPAEEPATGAPCNVDPAETCAYGDMCCPSLYGCFEGAWSPYDVNCAAPAECPAEPPAAGSSCGGPCLQVSPCGYACDQGSSILAECAGDTWQMTSSPCSDVVPCGDQTCPAGQICVESAGGAGFTYSCAPNPCAPAPLSCECAGSLCGGDPYECQVQSGSQLSCICSLCP
jgi:hypothetical protein